VKASLELQESGQIKAGGLNHLYVKHDDWCDVLNGNVGFCNCDPEIVFKGEIVG